VLIANDSDRIKDFEGKTAAAKPIPPLLCVPTTSGTGSELTFSAVITDTENRYKMTIKNRFTAARAAICDPELTLSAPPALTASTGMDALTHAIEAFTATCAEPLADAAALYAVELIYNSLIPAFRNGNNLEARSKMLMGSMLGGIAFSHADVASVHCIAEALGGRYDLPHGTCNSIILPYMMEYNMDYAVEGYARIARAMGLSPDSGKAGAQRAVEAVRRLAGEVELPLFSSLRIDPADFPAIAGASARNISNSSNPRPMGEEDYLALLKIMAREND
jgi:alcohol dehydrogenase